MSTGPHSGSNYNQQNSSRFSRHASHAHPSHHPSGPGGHPNHPNRPNHANHSNHPNGGNNGHNNNFSQTHRSGGHNNRSKRKLNTFRRARLPLDKIDFSGASGGSGPSAPGAGGSGGPGGAKSGKDGIDVRRCAFATMVIKNDEYMAGALCLAWSLRQCKSEAARVLLCDEEVFNKHANTVLKSKLFDEVVKIDLIECRAIQKSWQKYSSHELYDWINLAFSKFECFKLTQYQKVIMLDSDLLCVQNCDHLFCLPCPAGICSVWKDTNTQMQKKMHGTLCSNSDVHKAIVKSWGIRGCLFSIEPNLEIHQFIRKYFNTHDSFGDMSCFVGPDERFLSELYLGSDGLSAPTAQVVSKRPHLTSLRSRLDHEGFRIDWKIWSHWTHIESDYARKSYINYADVDKQIPWMMHYCTYKPWKELPRDKRNDWIYEQWEDYVIWHCCATCVTDEFDFLGSLMGDANWRMTVLKQKFSLKYIQLCKKVFAARTDANDTDADDRQSEFFMARMYDIMARSNDNIKRHGIDNTVHVTNSGTPPMGTNGPNMPRHGPKRPNGPNQQYRPKNGNAGNNPNNPNNPHNPHNANNPMDSSDSSLHRVGNVAHAPPHAPHGPNAPGAPNGGNNVQNAVMGVSDEKQGMEGVNEIASGLGKVAIGGNMSGHGPHGPIGPNGPNEMMQGNGGNAGTGGKVWETLHAEVHDEIAAKIEADIAAYEKMHPGMKPHSEDILLASVNRFNLPEKVIWQFWSDDYENIPISIRKCIDSVKENNPGWLHILLTPRNIWHFLTPEDLPNNILNFDRPAHISDAIRVAIIAQYGGIYCDSSIICFPEVGNCDFDYIWDVLLKEQNYDFVGMKYDERYDQHYGKWNENERFACWFLASKKDNGLMLSWSRKIRELMRNKQSPKQVSIVNRLTNDIKAQKFIKYTLLGPGILDRLFDEYVRNHPNFKYYLWDPRQFALLNHCYENDDYWYLLSAKSMYGQKKNDSWKQWLQQGKKCYQSHVTNMISKITSMPVSPGGGANGNGLSSLRQDFVLTGNFLKLFCAGKSIHIVKEIIFKTAPAAKLQRDDGNFIVSYSDILEANLLLSEMFKAAFPDSVVAHK